MKFIKTQVKTFIILFFFLTNAHSNEKIVYIDMNFLINTSKAGVSINNQMKKLVDQNNKEYEKLEKKLVNEENELLKKKNVVDPQQFNEEIKGFQTKIQEFRNKRKKNLRSKPRLLFIQFEQSPIFEVFSNFNSSLEDHRRIFPSLFINIYIEIFKSRVVA